MHRCFNTGALLLLILAACVSAGQAQTVASVDSSAAESSLAQSATYELKRGTNEFGFWGGFAPEPITSMGGLRPDEARGRKFFIAAFRYGRVIAANRHVSVEYTLDAIPLALGTNNIISAVRATPDGAIVSAQRETTYGAGVTPLGIQVGFSNRSKVKPFAHVNAGLLVFNKPFPLPDAGHLSFTLEGGGGVRIFTSERRAVSLGVRFNHISNGDRAGANRGVQQLIIYAGFSIFR